MKQEKKTIIIVGDWNRRIGNDHKKNKMGEYGDETLNRNRIAMIHRGKICIYSGRKKCKEPDRL